MTSATATTPITVSDVAAWNPSALATAAAHANTIHTALDAHFSTLHGAVHSLDWRGTAGDAAVGRIGEEKTYASGVATGIAKLDDALSKHVAAMNAAQQNVAGMVKQARDAGFQVDDIGNVTFDANTEAAFQHAAKTDQVALTLAAFGWHNRIATALQQAEQAYENVVADIDAALADPGFAATPPAPVATASAGGYSGRSAGDGGGDQTAPRRAERSEAANRDYSGGTATASPLTGGGRVQAQQIYQYLIAKYHLTPAQAAGILGTMQVESEFDTGAFNSGEGAIGLCQWEGGRRTELEQFAESQGRSATDWQAQVDFLMSELHGNESGAFAQIQTASTPAEAAAAFDEFYERSSGEKRQMRMANATNLANTMGDISV
jgi:hypothetical protein